MDNLKKANKGKKPSPEEFDAQNMYYRAVVRLSNLGGRINRLSICFSAFFSEAQNSGGADSSPDPLVAMALQLVQCTINVQSAVIFWMN